MVGALGRGVFGGGFGGGLLCLSVLVEAVLCWFKIWVVDEGLCWFESRIGDGCLLSACFLSLEMAFIFSLSSSPLLSQLDCTGAYPAETLPD